MADASNHKRTPKDIAQLASANLTCSRGDAVRTLKVAITDALHEQCEAEERERAREWCIKGGFLRSGSLTPQ